MQAEWSVEWHKIEECRLKERRKGSAILLTLPHRRWRGESGKARGVHAYMQVVSWVSMAEDPRCENATSAEDRVETLRRGLPSRRSLRIIWPFSSWTQATLWLSREKGHPGSTPVPASPGYDCPASTPDKSSSIRLWDSPTALCSEGPVEPTTRQSGPGL